MKRKIITLAALWLAILFVWVGGFTWQRRLTADEITITEPVSRTVETVEAEPTVWRIEETETAEPSPETTAEAEDQSEEPGEITEYIVNTSSKKIHLPDCSSVQDIKEANRSTTTDPEALIADGYTWCKRCHG